MRIACVDQSAAARVELQKLFDTLYQSCRDSIGHINFAQTYPASKEEVLLSRPPQIVAVGPALSLENAYQTCRDIKAAYPLVRLVVFINPENYSLRTLRRFERVSDEVFSVDEPAIRVVHKLASFQSEKDRSETGKLLTVNGVKGGVGTTSIVSGLAHAAEALGKTAVVIDLSSSGAFATYMSAQSWQSSDYAACLVDGIMPDRALVERCLATAPNGVKLLAPPSGGTDVRELWLRHPLRFELTLSIVEILAEMFDLIIVDIAQTEGVLQFALNCQAFCRVLVSSNSAASVHLLNGALSAVCELPGSGLTRIIVNHTQEKGLTREDVLDFLSCNQSFSDEMLHPAAIPFDSRARNWIGTGNTFYTEGSPAVQRVLEAILVSLFRGGVPLIERPAALGFLARLRLLGPARRLESERPTERKLLPLNSAPVESMSQVREENNLYEPPKRIIND